MMFNENFIIIGFFLMFKMWFKIFLYFFRSIFVEENKLFKSFLLLIDL